MAALNRERQAVQVCRATVRSLFRGVLARWLDESQRAIGSVAKATGALVPLPNEGFNLTQEELDELLAALAGMAQSGAIDALAALGASGLEVDVIQNASRMAEAWARNYGGAMVRQISQTTRDEVARIIGNGIAEGLSNSSIANDLQSAYTFSDERAEVIARTETAYADVAGNVASYAEAGVEMKRWVLGSDSCELCQENEAVGPIPFDAAFPDGSFAPPAHPNCTCDIIPVLT